jgi:amidase
MASAQAAEEEIADGRYRGALHGVPIAVKDLCFTTGVATTGGLQVLRDFVPDFDGTVVRRLNDAGAIILGKLNLTEGAMAGYNPAFDIPVNPWGADRWPAPPPAARALPPRPACATALWAVTRAGRSVIRRPRAAL